MDCDSEKARGSLCGEKAGGNFDEVEVVKKKKGYFIIKAKNYVDFDFYVC